MTKLITGLIGALFVMATLAFAASPSIEHKMGFLDRTKTIFGVNGSIAFGTKEFDQKALLNLQRLGERKELVEAIIARSEAVGLGVKISSYHAHLFLEWEDGEAGGFIVSAYAQIALDDNRRIKAIITTVEKQPAPPLPKATTVPSSPLISEPHKPTGEDQRANE